MSYSIERNKGILGGALILKGTRIPVSRILYLISRGRSIDYIIRTHYPFLSKDQVQEALRETAGYIDSSKNAE
jgi:uncharacterized protein (DUF433 family)